MELLSPHALINQCGFCTVQGPLAISNAEKIGFHQLCQNQISCNVILATKERSGFKLEWEKNQILAAVRFQRASQASSSVGVNGERGAAVCNSPTTSQHVSQQSLTYSLWQLSLGSGISECEAAHRRRCPRPGLAVHSWKSSYIRQHRIESNWRKGDGREPMVPIAAHTNPMDFRCQINQMNHRLTFFRKGVEGPRRPRDNVSAVQRRPDRQRLWWQHAQSLVGHHRKGKMGVVPSKLNTRLPRRKFSRYLAEINPKMPLNLFRFIKSTWC